MAKDEYRADYPDVDEYESEGEEKAYEDALYNLDDDYRIYYEILIFKYDKYVSVDLEVMGQKGDTTLWDTDTVLKNDYIDVNDVEGIREQAQSVANFISNIHFD
jgi:PKD repeat protein